MQIKFSLLAIMFLSTALISHGQVASEDKEVVAVIQKLFQGMQEGDSAKVRLTFTNEVSLVTLRDRNNAFTMQRESSLVDFLKAVGTPHQEIWYEEAWNYKVALDGGFAQVWCDYAFYVGKNFSHCGVDAFHLVKEKDGWKIFHLTDTRRKTNCIIPREIQDKHK